MTAIKVLVENYFEFEFYVPQTGKEGLNLVMNPGFKLGPDSREK